MLEFFRRQTKPIMIAVAVIIIIAFTFWGVTPGDGGQRGGYSDDHPMLTVQGSDYTMADVNRLQRSFTIARELYLPGVQDYFIWEVLGLKVTYADSNTGQPLMVSDAPVDFAANLAVLRDAMEQHGVRPSDDEVEQAFRGLGQFQVNGQYDPERALNYERYIREQGIKPEEVYQVVGDSIGLQKLHTIVSGNLVATPKAASEFYAFTYQTIKAASIPFALDDFKKGAAVTDEEIEKYFEENKENYQAPEKRAISYVLAAIPNTEGKNAEDTVKATRAYEKMLGELARAVIAPDADFEAEVKKAGLEVKTLPPFSVASPPEDLKKEFDLLRAVFLNNPATHAVSDPVEVENGYVIFKVTSIVEPAQQELAEVKDKVRDTLVEQKATEAMQKAANDAKAKVEAALKSGKTFEVAAKEAGLTPQMLAEFSPANPLTDLSNGREIAREAMVTPAGSFTKPLASENGVILVYVLSKELRKGEDSASSKKSIAGSVDERMQADIFRAWFDHRYEEAEVRFDPILLGASPSLR